MYTYKQIVDLFKSAALNHLMIQDFGYGQLSDIKTRNESQDGDQEVDYPYAFLNPTTHQRQQSTITYQFNLIMMDMARDEEGDKYDNFLTIQSECQQYIDDMVSELWNTSTKPDIQLTMTYTPFVERFQDELAGMTASISIVVPVTINNCIAPYN